MLVVGDFDLNVELNSDAVRAYSTEVTRLPAVTKLGHFIRQTRFFDF